MLDMLQYGFDRAIEWVENPKRWDSLIINRRKPHTYRVFATLPNGHRLCLHKFEVCDTHESMLHPHPWPAAFWILEGSYEMQIGASPDRVSWPTNVAKFVLSKNSQYEIVNPMTWHSVVPLMTTYTMMVNGNPWDTNFAHQDVRRTQGKGLEKMPQDELIVFLSKFKELLHEGEF